jgi:quercetin dioxygenase-like cupin family protein
MSDNASSEPARAYHVDRVETVLKTEQVLARVFTLVPGDKIPWHLHRLSSDHYFVLRGKLTIETDLPHDKVVLSAGDRYRVDPGTHHRVSNETQDTVSFLLLQGAGGYDWIKVDR